MFLSGNIGASHLSPDNDALFNMGGMLSAAGQRVSPDTALRLTATFACVRVLSEAVGQLPLHLYRREGRGKVHATEHRLYHVLHRRPNRWQTASEWREMQQGHLTLRGNAYSEIIAPRGVVTDLVPLNPDGVTVERYPDGVGFRYRYRRNDGTERILNREDVLHLRGLSSDGFLGINPIELEREAIGFGLAAQDYGARFYANGATMPGWIEFPGSFKTDEAKTKFRAAFQGQQVGANRFKTPVFEHGMKYHELQIKHTDLQFLETLKYRDTDIARIFRVPPHKIGILDRATWNNMEQQSLEFVIDTLMPWLVKWEQRLEESLLLDSERELYFFKFSVEGLLRGDAKTRAELYGEGIQDGWLTRNEVRELEDRDPLPGLDTPLEPLNMAPADRKTRGRNEEKQNGASRDALARWVISRIVGREVTALKKAVTRGEDGIIAARDFYKNHATHVASALCVPLESANEYCERMVKAVESGTSDIAPIAVDLLEKMVESGELK